MKPPRAGGWWAAVLGLAAAATLLLGASACSSEQFLRARIVDGHGQPLPGAILYAEAYTREGAFDFAFARAGPAGEVPPAGGPEARIAWRRGARLALAAFAPGKVPVVVYDPLGRVKADGIEMPLEDATDEAQAWEPRLARLSYPFEEQPALASRLRRGEYHDLRQAFRRAYAALSDGQLHAVLPAEREKIEAMQRLDEDVGASGL